MIGVISSPSSCRNIFHAKETWGEGGCRRGGCRRNHPGGSLQGFCVQECPPRSQSGSHSQSESTGEEMLKFLELLRFPGLHLFFWHILLWTFLVLPAVSCRLGGGLPSDITRGPGDSSSSPTSVLPWDADPRVFRDPPGILRPIPALLLCASQLDCCSC